MGEKVAGVAQSIEAKIELEAAGIDVSELRYALEYPYRKAREAAIQNSRAEGQYLSEESLKMIGREAGQQGLVCTAFPV